MLSTEKMSEAEVSLRLAFYFLRHDLVKSDVHVAIDGAQVKTANTVHFPIAEFLLQSSCQQCHVGEAWQGRYTVGSGEHKIVIHSNPGRGDVVAELRSGHTLRAESKKGTLQRSKSSSEYRLLREALGQLLTVDAVGDDDILAVVVPYSSKFSELARRWRRAPLIEKFGIRILTVDRDGNVNGLDEAAV